ncbi:MAG: hypothetical protein H7061_12790, partial [Bdellovibrionaceae bacterium]|nr:hypothetical protein [Bdellovibrio sp.]
ENKIKEAFKTNLAGLKIDQAIDQYWQIKGVKMGASALLMVDSKTAASALANMGATVDPHVSLVNLATNQMMKHFKEIFVQRLALTSERYKTAITEGDKNAVMAYGVQLTNLCGLAAGMYYGTQEESTLKTGNALRKVQSKPPEGYDEACKPVACLDKPRPLLFKSTLQDAPLADAFKAHVCQMQLDYDLVMQNVEKRIELSGTICR